MVYFNIYNSHKQKLFEILHNFKVNRILRPNSCQKRVLPTREESYIPKYLQSNSMETSGIGQTVNLRHWLFWFKRHKFLLVSSDPTV